ncbi:MAG TPA: chaperone modulator CbpM [Conexibacter sp.]|jgi:hypothetical protein|nr:chaperone modulator CbpM [Conexibacter sp.]
MTTVTRTRVTALVVRPRAPGGAAAGEGLIPLDALARAAGLHPELVRRLLALGVVEPGGGTRAAPLFAADAPAQLARAMRLRRDLALGWAGAVLAAELLDRIDDLEGRLRRYEPRPTNRPR